MRHISFFIIGALIACIIFFACTRRDRVIFSNSIEFNEKLSNADSWMNLACKQALIAVDQGNYPFGAILLQIDTETNNIIRYWKEHNHVHEWHDPTAHAEICVIRAAAAELGTTDLGTINRNYSKLFQPSDFSYCVLYSSAEPCPMCLAALYWSNIKEIFFAATIDDTAEVGPELKDRMIYEELSLPLNKRKYSIMHHVPNDCASQAFNYYKDKTSRDNFKKK